MTLARETLFWSAALAAAIAFAVVFEDILLPFVAGWFIAYLFSPLARRLERLGIARILAVVIVTLVLVAAIVVLLLLVLPAVVNQFIALIKSMPPTLERLGALVTDDGESRRIATLLGIDVAEVRQATQELLGKLSSWLVTVVEDLWTGGRTLLSVLSLLVITPVIAFYLLIDWERMSRAIDDALPRRHAPTIRRLLAEMDRSVGGFIHGQFIVGVILGTYYATALLAVGLDKALLIGIFAGIVSFIPYLGSTSGFLVSVGVAAGQFWPDWPWILVVAAVFLFGWFVEGNVLQPRLVGNRTGLHPVVLMFALVAFGSLFGFAGLLVGVPAAAAIGVLVRFAMSRYRASRLYLDEGDESATVRAGGGDGGDADAATPAERPSQEESR